MKHKILFIDDEENILKALKRLFRKSPYETFFELSGKDALETLRNEEISVLVTDMRMPEMTGVELIIEANKINPLCIKTILSGYADINDIMTAINSGHVHNYITKPWNESELMVSLMNATELYERRINEKNLLKELNEKNAELENLNKNLETIIKDRTWELQANNLILNSIMEGKTQPEIMTQISELISRITGDKDVLIYDAGSAKIFGTPFITEESEIFKKGRERTKACIMNTVLVIPLRKADELLGSIFINGVDKEHLNFTERLKNLNAILKMYLTQKALIANSSEMIGSIDKLLGNIDE